MWLDAFLAYLHYVAFIALFALLACQLVVLRSPLDATAIRRIALIDGFYGGASVLVLATGLFRLFLGAKGSEFYLRSWPFYAKVALFVAVGLMSIKPTLAYLRWRRTLASDPSWRVPEAERLSMRGIVLIEIHLGAMIPVFAVVMARGLGT